MERLAIAPRGVLARGAHAFGPFNIPVGTGHLQLRMARNAWPERAGADAKAREVFDLLVEFSGDGGLTWPEFIRMGGDGGAGVPNRRGDFPVENYIRPLPGTIRVLGDTRNSSRRVRVILLCVEDLDTQIDVDLI